MNTDLETVLQNPAVWRVGSMPRVCLPEIKTGFPELDRELPDRGWPRGVLTELICNESGIGEVSLLLPAVAVLTKADACVAWVAPPYLPYAPALAQAGAMLRHMFIVNTSNMQQMWWAAEQTMRSGACAAVLVWAPGGGPMDYTMLRRLQQSASMGACAGFVFRPRVAENNTSPAPLRIRLQAEHGKLTATILKRRGALRSQPIVLTTSANRWIDSTEIAKANVATPSFQRNSTLLDRLLRTKTRVPLVERQYPLPDR